VSRRGYGQTDPVPGAVCGRGHCNKHRANTAARECRDQTRNGRRRIPRNTAPTWSSPVEPVPTARNGLALPASASPNARTRRHQQDHQRGRRVGMSGRGDGWCLDRQGGRHDRGVRGRRRCGRAAGGCGVMRSNRPMVAGSLCRSARLRSGCLVAASRRGGRLVPRRAGLRWRLAASVGLEAVAGWRLDRAAGF
jgi:hypothetical protein